MIGSNLPAVTEMYEALVARDAGYEGIFFVGVKTTGVFCRPTCAARKPRAENVEFFASSADALAAGYRPCKRCRPLELNGRVPDWLRSLLDRVERDPCRRWKDAELRALGVDPVRVRRWFKANHGITFQGYRRARRLGLALRFIREGTNPTDTAYQTGYESVSGFRQAFGRLFEVAPGRCRGQLPICFKRLLTPLGPMVTAATPEGVCLLEFADRRMLEAQMRRVGRSLGAIPTPGVNEHLEHLEKQLASYFAGSPQEFTVPLILPGSDFQGAVWARLRRIPRGRTVSYREIARDIGRPGAERAVGRANGDNRICIVVPCHRVIRSDGSLGGYGGGLWRKKALLAHEGALLAASDTAGLERSGPSWALPRG